MGRCLNKCQRLLHLPIFFSYTYDLILPHPNFIPLEKIQAITTANGRLCTTFLLTIVMFTFKEKKHQKILAFSLKLRLFIGVHKLSSTLTCNKTDTAPAMTQVQQPRLFLHFQSSSYIAEKMNCSMMNDGLASFQTTHLRHLRNLQITQRLFLYLI